ncbi:hypothetical protein, conserved [Thermococcus onnurineus NA1]|uniref:CDC48 domain-containing protein n=1 Tax=Thermococcus onnurineus (strain NA1) TaxID=523850 RepID=B6YWM0_THEON|nr:MULTISPECIES: ATPase [Thermococcus]ACJ16483.1 hypothetical protein, conserved [Thermococcus onnurineus NA1]NJE41779.1 ATPase [Thermococcus sp. GR6]NJE47740.1 ATPase [Thermococcus sp. GR7]NJE78712.1 ATPase [Thermococcus sp. GR4]NJF22404.1 ATPase [Thermococcus sp. GR5]
MRLVLKPLFEAELPAGFEEIVREKLAGKEVRTNEEVEIDLLGKPLRFKVLLAEPSPMKVARSTRVEFSTGEVRIIDFEFDDPIRDVISFEKGFVVVFPNKVLILNHNGQKIYSDEFEELNKVSVSKETVVIVHGKNKLRFVKP